MLEFLGKIPKFLKFTPNTFVEEMVAVKGKVGNNKVVLGLSVSRFYCCSRFCYQTIGKNLYCIFVNNGLLRKMNSKVF
jgi:GMP synthase (glutamine-hydrolysing)